MPVIQQIHKHRSIRKYKPDPVPEALLTEILEAGIRSPSSGNMQAFSIIATRDAALREKLLGPHLNQSMVIDAPVLLTFCADFHRMRRWLKLSDAPDNFDNYFSFMIGAIDAILVSQTVALAAESRGLGLCYLGSTLANADQIGKILGLPRQVVPVVGYSLGYPAEDPAPRDRLPLAGLIHHEIYQEYSDDDIQSIYQERETRGWQRYMKSDWLRNQVETRSVENLAQLYTRIKYTRPSYQEISKRILAYLTEQDFMHQEDQTGSGMADELS
jgi:nitroreductase